MVLSFRTVLVILELTLISIFLWIGRRYAFSMAYTSAGIFLVVWCIFAFPVRCNQAMHCSFNLSTLVKGRCRAKFRLMYFTTLSILPLLSGSPLRHMCIRKFRSSTYF